MAGLLESSKCAISMSLSETMTARHILRRFGMKKIKHNLESVKIIIFMFFTDLLFLVNNFVKYRSDQCNSEYK